MDIKIKKRLLSGLTALMVLVGAPTVLPNVINQQALAEDEHVHSPQEGTYSPSGLSQHTYTCENSDSNCPDEGTVTEDCDFSGSTTYKTADDTQHTKSVSCTRCTNKQETTESHEISTTYTQTATQHTQKDTCTDNCGYEKTHEATDHTWDKNTGKCNVCEYECQHTYTGGDAIKYEQNGDGKTHKVTKTCDICGKQEVTESEACSSATSGDTCDKCKGNITKDDPCVGGHTYTGGTYGSDEKQHWQICDNCSQPSETKTNHSYITDSTSKVDTQVTCVTCGKTHTHNWDSDSSAGEGQTKYTCDTCGATATVTTTTTPTTHTHSYGSEYQNDGKGHHWKKCVGEGTCDITDNSKHAGYGDCADGDDEDTLCDTCGFDMSNLSTDPGDDEDEDTSSDDYDEEDDDTSSVPSTPSTPSEPSTPPTPPTVEEVIENMAEDLVADTDISADAPETAIATGAEDLITMLFTENEIKSLDGVNVSVTLSVSANENDISAADISAVDDAVVDTDYDVAGYFDISLYKSIADLSKSRVTKTNGSLTLVIDIPEELVDADREFAMIRVHDGETDVLDDLDDNPDTITFETDRFSTYALVYKTQDSSAVVDPGDDSPVDDPTGGDNTGDTTDDDNTGDSNFPATGVAGLAIFPVIIAGATVIAAKSKKK